MHELLQLLHSYRWTILMQCSAVWGWPASLPWRWTGWAWHTGWSACCPWGRCPFDLSETVAQEWTECGYDVFRGEVWYIHYTFVPHIHVHNCTHASQGYKGTITNLRLSGHVALSLDPHHVDPECIQQCMGDTNLYETKLVTTIHNNYYPYMYIS